MEPEGPAEWHIAAEFPESTEPSDSSGFSGSSDDDEDPWADEDTLPAYVPAPPGRGRRGPGWVMAAVAVAAATAGVVIGLTFLRWPGTDAAGSPTASASPSAIAPAPGGNGASGGGNGGLPALSPQSGNGSLQVQVVGTVTAVSRASITIGGEGASVTAAFGTSTRFSGVPSATGIKVGDQVGAILTGTPGQLTVASLKDPA